MENEAIYYIPAKPLSTLCERLGGRLHTSYVDLNITGDIFATLNITSHITRYGVHTALSELLEACRIPYVRENIVKDEPSRKSPFSPRCDREKDKRFLIDYSSNPRPMTTPINEGNGHAAILETVQLPLSPWSSFAIQLLDRDRPPLSELAELASTSGIKEHVSYGQLQVLIETAEIADLNSIKEFITVAKSVTHDPGAIKNEWCHNRADVGWGTHMLLHYVQHIDELSVSDFNQIISELWAESPLEQFHLQLITDLEGADTGWRMKVISAMNTAGILPDDKQLLTRLSNIVESQGSLTNKDFLERIKWKRLTHKAATVLGIYIDSEPTPKPVSLKL